MMQVIDAKNIENDDLICPITLELFHDPVIATDGHIYEREAITRWILEHGTSPFTREPLQINDLRSDDNLKRLATQRRNSTVSYNAGKDSVTLPPLRRIPRRNTRVAPEQGPIQIGTNYYSNKSLFPIICCIIIVIVVITLITVASVLGIKNSSWNSSPIGPQIRSDYSSSLTNTSSLFRRPNMANDWYYYKAIQVVVSTNGFYSFTSVSQIDMYGYLYARYFNATNPSINLLAYDDDSGDGLQFYFRFLLKSGNYVLVATTYNATVIGPFSIVVNGPANVVFQ